MQTTVAEEVQDGVYVTVERFAEITGLTAWVIRKMVREETLPALKGKSYMIHKKDALAALRSKQNGA